MFFGHILILSTRFTVANRQGKIKCHEQKQLLKAMQMLQRL